MVLEQSIVFLNTAFLGNFLIFFIFTLSFIGYLSLNKIYFLQKDNQLNLLVLKSIIFLSYSYLFFATLSFISPLNYTISILYILFGLLIFFYLFYKKKIALQFRWVLMITFIITIYTYKSGFNNDFNYHFEHINLFKNFTVSNFLENSSDIRIKYNSAFILLNSITFIEFFEISVKFLSAFIFTLFIIDMRGILLNKELNSKFLKFGALFFLISIFITLSKFKNIGTDYVAHIFYLTLVMFYLIALKTRYNFYNSKKFFIILIISLATLTILKISLILSCLIIFHYFYIIYINKNLKIFLTIYLIIPISIIIIWFSHNLILSKCIIFPISKLCFANDKEITSIIFENTMISLYAKDVILNYWNTPLSELIHMNSISYWFSFWIVNGFYEILEKFIPILIIFYMSIFNYFKKNNEIIKIDIFNSHILFYILIICSLTGWLLQAPAFRFGFSYLVIFLFFTNIYILEVIKFPSFENLKSTYFTNICNLFFLLFFLYQILRINTV